MLYYITREIQFSVDDFERVGTSPWEGVRNYEARNLMKEMAVGEKVISYPFNGRFTRLTGQFFFCSCH